MSFILPDCQRLRNSALFPNADEIERGLGGFSESARIDSMKIDLDPPNPHHLHSILSPGRGAKMDMRLNLMYNAQHQINL